MELSSVLENEYVTLGALALEVDIPYGTLYSRLRRYKVPHERLGWQIAIKREDSPKLTQPKK